MCRVTGGTRRVIRNRYPAASSSAGGLGTSMYTEVSRILIFGWTDATGIIVRYVPRYPRGKSWGELVIRKSSL